jgi:hypothetical protein
VVLNASATDSDPGPLTYKWEVQNPGSTSFSTMRDFDLLTEFTWVPNYVEGTYQLRLTARDYLAGTSAQVVVNYVVNPLVTGTQPVAVATANPLVALFSAPNCPAGSTMTIYYKLQGSSAQNTTDARACHTGTQNFYVAGMMPSKTYVMTYAVTTSGTTTKGPLISFTTGPLTTSLTFPTLSVPIPPSSGTDSTNPVVLGGYPDPGGFPLATDLEGNIIYYYPDAVQLTRPVPGGTMLALPSGKGTGTGVWGPNVTRQQIVREYDLAGNTLHETNCDRVYEQLEALGMTDPLGRFNHDAIRLSNGQTVVLGDEQRIFPAGTQGSTAPLDIIGSLIIFLDDNFQVLTYWSAFDHYCTTSTGICLDINRPGDEDCVTNSQGLTPGGCPPVLLSSPANDWTHNNSIEFLTADNDLLASLRNQNWIVKIDWNNGTGTGGLLWRLGTDGDFTVPGTSSPDWFSGQHDAGFVDNGETILMLFNNNVDAHAHSGANSHGQVWTLNTTNLTATPTLDQDVGSYSPSLGSAELLNNGDYVFVSGNIQLGHNSIEVQNTEMTTSGVTNYQFQSIGVSPAYRGWRLTSLYSATLDGSSGPE